MGSGKTKWRFIKIKNMFFFNKKNQNRVYSEFVVSKNSDIQNISNNPEQLTSMLQQ